MSGRERSELATSQPAQRHTQAGADRREVAA
jgi:hypothetical protein